MSRFICVANQKGGVGKTGLAGFIARSLGRKKEADSPIPQVILADRDGSCDASLYSGLSAEVCSGPSPDERLKGLAACFAGAGERVWYDSPFEGVGILPGKLGFFPESGQLSSAAQFSMMNDLVSVLRKSLPVSGVPHLVFDFSSSPSPADLMLVFRSDVLVLPVTLELPSLRGMLLVLAGMARCHEHLKRTESWTGGFPRVFLQPWGKVENKDAEWRFVHSLERIGEKYGFSVLPLLPIVTEFTKGVFSEGKMLSDVKKNRKVFDRAEEFYRCVDCVNCINCVN